MIVVYKVDRLTRSLADFAKLVELFDAYGVSFVSVTQQFNTTTSMGRLTLNVLLSFAQFEREVTSERIRDKIAASKRKGLWVGGVVPLSYEVQNRKVIAIPEEAERVRIIFRRYLDLGGLNLLLADLRHTGIQTKVRPLCTGRTIGGIPFTRGPLAYLLRNRFYIGEVLYKGEICRGEQPPILDRDLFEAVQARLDEQRSNRTITRARSRALLRGRIFDDAGDRMTPTHVTKRQVRYRYYISAAVVQGQKDGSGSVTRVPAAEIEVAVAKAIRGRLGLSTMLEDQDVVATHLESARVMSDHIVIQLKQSEYDDTTTSDVNHGDEAGALPVTLTVNWNKTSAKRHRDIIVPEGATGNALRPARAETRDKLLTPIAQGRRWLSEVVSGSASVESIAKREACSARRINMTLSLAFLAPNLVKAAIDRRLPRGIGVTRLFDPPVEWSRQQRMLGLAG